MMPSEPLIRLEGLTKVFRERRKRVTAVQAIDLEIEAGQVYGFLGPNGAGKTTTIRMMLDLIRPTAGQVHLFGTAVRRKPEVLHRVGAIVEGPAFYNYMSGRRNLEVFARTSNRFDPGRINALLRQVGLAERADERVSGYSLGMKQRLAVAAVQVTDPDLLIFDEPTNGLDPAGIQEMRLFIRSLVDQHGKTVFLSSHLLSEVEQVCDRVAIINRGQIVREGPVTELLRSQARVRVEAEPLADAAAALSERWRVAENGSRALWVEAARAEIPQIVRALTDRQIAVFHIADQHLSLEDYFLSVTRDEAAHDQPVPR
jgi:ABC-2 type transport system ATP-binding protein